MHRKTPICSYLVLLFTLSFFGCHHPCSQEEALSAIQIQDRNGLIETISTPDRLENYKRVDFLTAHPYKKVLRVYKQEGKTHSKITTYHPNGSIWKYLEAKEMRAFGTYREWHPNGQLRIEASLLGGTADVTAGNQKDWIFDSICSVWDEQGQLTAEIPYEKGVLEGVSLYYYPDGALEKKLPFARGLLQGEGEEYFPSGSIKSTTSYKNGEKQGESRGFFSNGSLAWIENYKQGQLLTGFYYSPQGELLCQTQNKNGKQALFDQDSLCQILEIQEGIPQGKVEQYNDQGQLQGIYHMKQGKKHGEELVYALPSQHPRLSLHWNEGEIHGAVKSWYLNGQLESEKNYAHNQKTGSCVGWYLDGSLMFVEEYEEDSLQHGHYYKKGLREPVSSVVHGTGLALLYDEEGIFLRKVHYVKGKPIDLEG